MKYSDIYGLSPVEIQKKFALPHIPKYYCFVDVPAGTEIYVGFVNESSVKGTLQYELKQRMDSGIFGVPIELR